MISFLRGTVAEALPQCLVVDVNGVGYEVTVPLSTFDQLNPMVGQGIMLKIHMHVRENAQVLYGFATDAEREVDDLYKTMYMSEHIGEEFDAVISGVTSFGLFAELPNTIEGFIPIETLFGEYKFDADRFRLIGKETYTIGEELHIKVVDVDFERRRTEFRLLYKKKDDSMS